LPDLKAFVFMGKIDSEQSMQQQLLLGDEAFAQGAMDAGLSGFYGYPGTPSTEIGEFIQHSRYAQEAGIVRVWSANEKTAMEAAIGMSYAGKRAIVTMKHVGLNVAADPYINSALTGANGGLIVAAADDPSMHSSQNEQDSRFYANFGLLPILEPSNQQECYDMARFGFEMSERYHLPILLRLTTRLSHSRAGIKRGETIPQNPMKTPADPNQFMLLPAVARAKYKKMLAMQPMMEQEAENSPFNKYFEGADKSLGIIACGLGYNYLRENLRESNYPILKISHYPLPRKLIERMFDECDEVLVLEEGMPLVEDRLRGFLNRGKPIHGRLDGTISRDGELNPGSVRAALRLDPHPVQALPEGIVGRPPALCVGCPHADTYKALKAAVEPWGQGHVFSDIGCYTLGFMPPFQAINSCVEMGASITMAIGAADAGLYPAIGVIGDSTFGHSGITGLLDAVNKKANVVVVILDNETTAMTGMQDSIVTDRLERICTGLGVDPAHIRVLNPLTKHHEENVKIIREEIDYPGVSVIIPRRPCIHIYAKRMKQQGGK
jgi:indolepyruvate ferredoxin oxidoreductase alpha subunit